MLSKPISTPLGAGDSGRGCLSDDCYDGGASWLDDSVCSVIEEQNNGGLAPSHGAVLSFK